jgi:polyisoprenoid-binding protein YceI
MASSVNTGDDKRDGHLKSPDFFDVQKFPELTFKSTKIEKKGDGFIAYGPLTIHGVSKDVELPFTIAGTIKDGMGKTHLVAQSTIIINRKDYGLTWNRAVEGGGVLVGEEVKIDLSVEAVK